MLRRGAFKTMPSVLFLLLLVQPSDAAPAAGDAMWRILARNGTSLRLEVVIPDLQREVVELDGTPYVTLSLDRAGLVGAPGTPGLPSVGRLVAVPAGARVGARVVKATTHELPAGRLLPVQPASATRFALDTTAYARPGWTPVTTAAGVTQLGTDGGPTVVVGAPQLLAGQAVVPLNVIPVAYDPVSGRLVVANRVEIELRFDARDGVTAPASRRHAPNEALIGQLPAAVLGVPDDRSVAAPGDSPGTWALVYGYQTALDHLQPLIAWRRQQGYHVEIIHGPGPNTDVKAQLQSLYDDPDLPPLTDVLIAGDTYGTWAVPTWHESLSGYAGEGDNYYTFLDGDDILPDAHIGRITFDDLAMLDRIVAKIVGYETAPPMDDTAWFTEASLIGDPASSGITTIYVNQWLKGQLQAHGYTAVDTAWSGDFSGFFYSSLNRGKSLFGYRGFFDMSGISTGLINALENGARLPVAILPTCDTGSFAGSTVCRSEAFLRAPNGGAVAAIATATLGTHTRYNNCYYVGAWNGLLNHDNPHIGAAHTSGKLELYTNYYLAEPDNAEIWAVWNNLMGDPATAIWLSVPRVLTVEHPAQVSVATGAVTVAVLDSSTPVAGARVCLFRDGEVQVSGVTDATGAVTLVTPPLTAGTCAVTVTGDGLLPYRGSLSVGVVDVACVLADRTLDDSAGNGDGQLNPGETVTLALAITNHGTQTATAVTGQLEGGDPWGSVMAGALSFGDVAPGATVWATTPATVAVDAAAPDGTVVSWPLQLASGSDVWMEVVQVTVHAAAFGVSGLVWSAGATFEPGQSGSLVITLANDGSLDAANVTATLATDSPWLQITDPAAVYGAIDAGSTADNALDPFAVSIAAECFPGHLAVLHLTLDDGAGGRTTAEVPVTVGTAATDAPTGPGAGGYYAFDDTDVASGHAPVFDWVALDPNDGGQGVPLELTDHGFEQDDTRTIDLPFTFRFYGVDFDRVSICSNGWLAMGETPLVNYRNTALPGADCPGSLIAAFWDDLYQLGAAQIYTYHDEVNRRFIVQWYHLNNDFSGAMQNFEIILLDPVWHPTATGDGAIILQYEQVNNTDSRDGFATVGLQNNDRTGGLLYTYWNQYAAGAAPLAAGRAIRFEPIGAVAIPTASVTPSTIEATTPPGGQVTRTLHISNTGVAGSVLGYTIDVVDPATLPPAVVRRTATPLPPDIQGSTLTFDTTNYDPGTTADIMVSVHAEGSSWLPLLSLVRLQCPPGVTLNTATDLMNAGSSVLPWLGPAGSGVLTTWDGLGGEFLYYIAAGTTATATVNLTFAPDIVGDLVFEYVLEDVGLFGDPDQVLGSVILASDQPYVALHTPTEGAVAVIGQELPVTFVAGNTSGLVDIALQRDMGGAWTDVATDVDAAAGSWTWLVTGDPGPYARIRIRDAQNASVADTSGVFTVGRDVSWVQLAETVGFVAAGTEDAVTITLQAATLAVGTYEAVLRVATSTGEVFPIPIALTVSTSTDVGDQVPDAVVLRGNYPNPFNPTTAIAFTLPRAMPVTLDVFATDGKRVRRLVEGELAVGAHDVIWDGTDARGRTVASGVYVVRLVTADGAAVRKMVLAK